MLYGPGNKQYDRAIVLLLLMIDNDCCIGIYFRLVSSDERTRKRKKRSQPNSWRLSKAVTLLMIFLVTLHNYFIYVVVINSLIDQLVLYIIQVICRY